MVSSIHAKYFYVVVDDQDMCFSSALSYSRSLDNDIKIISSIINNTDRVVCSLLVINMSPESAEPMVVSELVGAGCRSVIVPCAGVWIMWSVEQRFYV